MIEKTPEFNKEQFRKEQKERSRIRTEQEYVDMAVKYALSLGWVKEEQREILVEKYLKPIHKKYHEIIAEMKAEEEVSEEDLETSVRWLNLVLESTRRIGSTDRDNIIRDIEDYKNRAPYPYAQYAVESLSEIIQEII